MGIANIANKDYKVKKVVTVLSGESTSEPVDIEMGTIVGIETPATLTGTSITFSHVKRDGDPTVDADYLELKNASALPVAADGLYWIDANETAPLTRWAKVDTGASEGADRELTLIVHPVG